MAAEPAPVLLVEDSPDDRFLFQRCWEKCGVANPLVALDDGQRAVDRLAGPEARPALVFLDLKLPVKNGFEVLQWIRGHEAVRHVPVLVLTASEQPGDVARAYVLGANAYLVKPSSVEELRALVEAAVRFWLRFNVAPVP